MYIAIIIWLIMGAVASHFAAKRGRDPLAWFFLGTFFGFIAIIILFILQPINMKKKGNAVELEITPESVINLPVDYKLKDWFYIDSNGEQKGPVGFDAMNDLIKQKEIDNHTYIWCEGMHDWEKAEFLGIS